MILNIQSLVNKLSLIGRTVLDYNDFGIIYSENSELKLLKITSGQTDYIDGFSEYVVTKHFIALKSAGRYSYTNSYRLYIRNSNINQLEHIGASNCEFALSYFGLKPYSSLSNNNLRQKDSNHYKVCAFSDYDDRLYLINHNGKYINLNEPTKSYGEVVSIELSPSENNESGLETCILKAERHTIGDGSNYLFRMGFTIQVDEELNIKMLDFYPKDSGIDEYGDNFEL